MADHVNTPALATAAGLLLYGHRNRPFDPGPARGLGALTGRLWGLLKEFF
jgi:hypothetical protein